MKKKINKLSQLLLLMVAIVSFLPGMTNAQENRQSQERELPLATALSTATIVFKDARSMSGKQIDAPQKASIMADFEALRKYTQNKKPVRFTESKTY